MDTSHHMISTLYTDASKDQFRDPATGKIDGKAWCAYNRTVEANFDAHLLTVVHALGPCTLNQLADHTHEAHGIVGAAITRLQYGRRLAVAEEGYYDHQARYVMATYRPSRRKHQAFALSTPRYLTNVIRHARACGAKRIRAHQSSAANQRLTIVFHDEDALEKFWHSDWCDPFNLHTPVACTRSRGNVMVVRLWPAAG